jgi:hypothetical protein
MNTPNTAPIEPSPRSVHRHLPRALLRQPHQEALRKARGALLWTTGTTIVALDRAVLQ